MDLKQTLAVHLGTAHPHFGRDGTMYNLGTSFNPTAAYGIVAVPPKQPDAGLNPRNPRIVLCSLWRICHGVVSSKFHVLID